VILEIPDIALSVRQPWAWAILHAGKDIENRSSAAVGKGSMVAGRRIAIHAAKGMTQDEYLEAARFMFTLGVVCPPARELLRGGIIGSVRVIDIVRASESPWFFGPRGLVLKAPEACAFIPSVGALGFFRWKPKDGGAPEPPARWMRRLSPGASDAPTPPHATEQGVLL
jgi:hypothetical protein